MSNVNPYAATVNVTPEQVGCQKVDIRPIELFKRAYQLMREQYMLFVGITLVGILLGSMVPFGILMGPIMVGIYLCYLHREAGRQVEFATLFKGFDQFKEAFIAFIIMFAISMGVMLGFIILIGMVVLGMGAAMQGQGNDANPSAIGIVLILMLYLALLVASIAVYIPFLFAFQLIADRKLSGMDAVKLSWAGVKKNLGGILVFMIVNMFFSLIAVMMCYIPAIFFMPISFGALFLLYRDIYGTNPIAFAPTI